MTLPCLSATKQYINHIKACVSLQEPFKFKANTAKITTNILLQCLCRKLTPQAITMVLKKDRL